MATAAQVAERPARRATRRGRLRALMLFPDRPGWMARFTLTLFIIIDRIINASRISETEIRDVSALDSYAIFQILTTIVAAAYLSLIALDRQARSAVMAIATTPLVWIALYMLLAIASSLWSGAFLLTAFKAIQCLVFFVTAIICLVGLEDLRQRIVFVAAAAIYYLVASYVMYAMVTVPELGLNIISLHFVVGTVPFVGVVHLMRVEGLRAARRKFYTAFVPFIVIETILTVYLSLIASEMIRYFLASRRLTRYLGVIAPLLGVAALLLLIPDDPNASILGIKTVREISSGTGRFEVWEFVLTRSFPEAPMFGHGFVVGDAVARAANFTAALGQLHNSFLSALSNLGLIGFALWMLFLLGSYRLILRHPTLEVRLAFAGCAVVCLFQQMAGGASLSSPMHVVWISHAWFFGLVAIESIEVRAAARGKAVVW